MLHPETVLSKTLLIENAAFNNAPFFDHCEMSMRDIDEFTKEARAGT
jgi:hypothetical protein